MLYDRNHPYTSQIQVGRGLVQASTSGVIAAREIISRSKS